MLRPDPHTIADPDAIYDQVVRLDLSTLEPNVVGTNSPDQVCAIFALAAETSNSENDFVYTVSSALMGSCTNLLYDDVIRAADVAEQARAHGLSATASFLVTVSSERGRATIERDGQIEAFKAIDSAVLANARGPFIGQWRRNRSETPNTILTFYNSNFPRQNDGQPQTMNFIASPNIVTAIILVGRLYFNPLSDTLAGPDGREFRLSLPRSAPRTPDDGFEAGEYKYVAPP